MLKIIILSALLSVFSLSVADTDTTNKPKPLPIMRGVGGDFSAIGVDGKPFQLSRYKGKITLLFFGYTNCADICPFTLGYLKEVYEKLTPDEQKKVQVVFVTIDPEYDTPEHLQDYIRFFNKDFTAATGTRKQIDEIVKQYQAVYNKTSGGGKVKTKEMRRINQKNVADKEKDDAYVYSHTVNIYVMDGKLRVRSLEYTGTKQEKFVQIIRRLIAEKNPNQQSQIKQVTDKTTETKKTSVAPIADTKTVKPVVKKAPDASAKDKVKLPVLLNYWVHLGPPNTRVMAAYADFVNTTDKDIYLVGVEDTDFDHVELHDTIVEGTVGKMVEQEKYLIPAGGTLKFEVGKRHIMLVTPFKQLKHNGTTTMTLKYQVAGSDEILKQTLDFPVSFNGQGCGAMPIQ